MRLETSTTRAAILGRIRWTLGFFILALVVSGITAFPLQLEVELIATVRGVGNLTVADAGNGFDQWILILRDGLRDSYARHPWLAYGTDWLAFAHLVIALFFIGPFRDPVRNVWVLQAGFVACILVVPLALICGSLRGIPLGWRLIDCSFGVFGVVPLWHCLNLIRRLEKSGTE